MLLFSLVGNLATQQFRWNVMRTEHKSRGTVSLCAVPLSGEGRTHHDDPLDGADDAVHEGLELDVVIEVVGVADAHEEEERWQAGDHVDHHTFGLQVCGEQPGEEVQPELPGQSGTYDAHTQDDVLD